MVTAIVIAFSAKSAYDWRQRNVLDNVTSQEKDHPTPLVNDQIGWSIQPIGVVRSVYRLCVGTPRQGLLAPHARGRIELVDLPYDHALAAVDGLDTAGFSHIWIMFVFHLNTVGKNKRKTPLKIAAPARGGAKRVGVLATRSPHRFNPIGITLARLEGVKTIYKKSSSSRKQKAQRIVSLSVSGLDLVDGTPVIDIKPYVGVYDSVSKDNSRVPPWVAQGLATRRRVEWTDFAVKQLEDITARKGALEFFDPGETSQVRACIDDVLAVDVRSAFQTQKARAGKFQAERSKRISQQSAQHQQVEESEEGQGTEQLDN